MEIPPPTAMLFTGNLSENWKRFKQRLDLHLEVTDSSQKTEKVKTSIMLHVIGDEAIDIYNTFKFDGDDDKWTLAIVKKKFEDFFTPKKNTTLEKFHFNRCIQNQDESVDKYVTRLKALS